MDRREFLQITGIAAATLILPSVIPNSNGVLKETPILIKSKPTTQMTLNSMFKEVYADKIENLIPDGVKLLTRS